jgi:hypothetical protein
MLLDICHLPDYITFFVIVVYVALIKQAVVKRRRSECSTHSNALDDVKVLNTTNPPSHSLYLRKQTSFRDIDQDLADNEKTVNIKI